MTGCGGNSAIPTPAAVLSYCSSYLDTLSLPLRGKSGRKTLLTVCSIATATAIVSWWLLRRKKLAAMSRIACVTQAVGRPEEVKGCRQLNSTLPSASANPAEVAQSNSRQEEFDDSQTSQLMRSDAERARASLSQAEGNTEERSLAVPKAVICLNTEDAAIYTSDDTDRNGMNSPTNSEGSADSGRATGRPASCSPSLLNLPLNSMTEPDVPPMYEFEVHNSLVGLIIGVKGKTIRELCLRADVKMLIRPHFTPSKCNTHQICSVEGRRENVNKCLRLIRHRFPQDRFPDLNLKPILPLPLPTGHCISGGTGTCTRPPPTPLNIPVDVPCEVYISAHVDAAHFFCQLPTHPTFRSLQLLDYYMLQLYGNQTAVPELPKPCSAGVLCAAPAYNGWFRAITLLYDEEQDETIVRFVDYGGFARIPRADLRQIRTDFMALPLQAIECYLAHVQPADGSSHWSEQANEIFQKFCRAKICQAQLIGYNKSDNIPVVELYVLGENKKVLRIDKVLLERGLAKPADPSKVIEPTPKQITTDAKNGMLRHEGGHRVQALPLLLTPSD